MRPGHEVMVGLLCCALGAGCSVDSEHVRTSGIWANFHVEHRVSDEVVAQAWLAVGAGLDGNPLNLTGGDTVECNGVTLGRGLSIDPTKSLYQADVAPDPEGQYVFTMHRTGEELVSIVQTPAIPVVTGTVPADVVNTDGDLSITWDAAVPGRYANVWVDGDCIVTMSSLNETDDGELTMTGLGPRDPANPTECALWVTVVRYDQGPVNPAFLGGAGSATIADEVAGPQFVP